MKRWIAVLGILGALALGSTSSMADDRRVSYGGNDRDGRGKTTATHRLHHRQAGRDDRWYGGGQGRDNARNGGQRFGAMGQHRWVDANGRRHDSRKSSRRWRKDARRREDSSRPADRD